MRQVNRGHRLQSMRRLALMACLVANLTTGGYCGYGCSTDFTCEWISDSYNKDIRKCCNDHECHENCAADTVVAILFFVVFPLAGCVCCAAIIGSIAYCALKKENKTGVIHSSTHQVPTAYYNSSAFSTNYSTTPGGLASPYNPGDNPFPPVSPPTYQQTSAMTGTSGFGGYQQPPPRYGSAVQNENSKFPAQETNYGYFQS
ncbi:uncharacterized protein LOC142344102 [Convolutriloba macropyga]|uniref:uncharacterized protein LOC142344102 n=1 Tax=Convolutriloba macropyga TaxID=536237 RepID=UPI003F51C54D